MMEMKNLVYDLEWNLEEIGTINEDSPEWAKENAKFLKQECYEKLNKIREWLDSH